MRGITTPLFAVTLGRGEIQQSWVRGGHWVFLGGMSEAIRQRAIANGMQPLTIEAVDQKITENAIGVVNCGQSKDWIKGRSPQLTNHDRPFPNDLHQALLKLYLAVYRLPGDIKPSMLQ